MYDKQAQQGGTKVKVSQIIESVKQDSSLTRGTILSWLEGADLERDLIKVDQMQEGDTFWYTVVGGKRRPWVTLWVRKGLVGAASLTHTEMEGGWPCQDRMWGKGCYIGPTLIVAEEDRVKDSIYYPYSNKKHLREIKQKIKGIWG